MYSHLEEARQFQVGFYVCPRTNKEVELVEGMPRAWVHWPVEVSCSACGESHRLEYADVRQSYPAFGRE